MHSFDNYIKFALDIKNQNIVFEDYFFRLVNGHKQKVYQAILLPMPVSQSLLDFLSRESGAAPAINAQ